MTEAKRCSDGCPLWLSSSYVPGCRFWNTLLGQDAKVCDKYRVAGVIDQAIMVLQYLNEESETCKPVSAETAPDIAEACPATNTPKEFPKPS
jgi:hypothetical protein